VIRFTEIPLFGDSEGVLTGEVSCTLSDEGAVVVYIRKDEGDQVKWWIKPDFGQAALIPIQSDGTWSVDVTMYGQDYLASEFLAFLVPIDISLDDIPMCGPCDTEPFIPQALASVWVNRSPEFQVTYCPPLGATEGYLEGIAWGSINPLDWRVVVYITVAGRTWVKPNYGGEALTPIQEDGGWFCDIVTGGIDEQATHIYAFLVPATIDLANIPMCGETLWCGEGVPDVVGAVDLIVIDRMLFK
jgi:hypothetical protein